jgi:hypothetical protein
MNPTRRNNIITVLTAMLNRAPSENEIQNAQTDTVVMGRVLAIELGI